MLGLGACLILRARGADAWAAFALGAALLHTVNHAVFKSLLFLGAGAFERAAGSLELDRLGGLLRRMPWTAAAFLVGAMAISGSAAAERLRLRMADPAGAPACRRLRSGRGRDRRRARARRTRRDRRARPLLLRQGRRSRAARAGADGAGRSRGGLAATDAGGAGCCLRAPASRSASRRVSSLAHSSGSPPGLPRCPPSRDLSCPAPVRCRESGSLLSSLR